MRKADARKKLLACRAALSQACIQAESALCIQRLKDYLRAYLRDFSEKELYIYAYYPLEREINLLPLYEEILAGRWDSESVRLHLAFPRVWQKEMEFYAVEDLRHFEKGAFGVLEPKIPYSRLAPAEKGLVLVPCLGIHQKGYRLGYGAGYYDRYFAQKREVRLLGITFSFAGEQDFSCEDYDICMDSII